MVGIPGRSKGCVTCRKRKKGCDLGRPACGQCRERGISCGGYDADRVFIYQNHRRNTASQGMLSFTAIEDQDATTRDGAIQFAIPTTQADMMLLQPFDNTITYNCSPRQSCSISFDQFGSFVQTSYCQKGMEAFLRMYAPTGDLRGTNSEGQDFVNIIPLLSVKDPALRSIILAMGTAYLGQNTGDKELIQQGRWLYGKALKETAVALRDPSRAKSDAFLAVPRIMSLWEMLFGAEGSSAAQAKGFLSHAVGETALIVSRGPSAYAESDAAHMLFVNARYRTFIAAARGRKAAIFNQEAWKTLPWKGRVKTPNDSLVDIMYGIPELMEAVDNLRPSSTMIMTSRERVKYRRTTISCCWTLHIQLQAWAGSHGNDIYVPPTPQPNTADPLSFPSLDVACLTAKYWVAGLLLYDLLSTALAIPSEASSPSPSSTPSPPRYTPSHPHPCTFARLITRSVPYFFTPSYGIVGATSISFPLGAALLYFRTSIEDNKEFMSLVFKSWKSPNLPSSIQAFLVSMRSATVEKAEVEKWNQTLKDKCGTKKCGDGEEGLTRFVE